MNKYIKYSLFIILIIFLVDILYTLNSLYQGSKLSQNTHTQDIIINNSNPQLNVLFTGDSIAAGIGADNLNDTAYFKFTNSLSSTYSINATNNAVSGYKVKDLLIDTNNKNNNTQKSKQYNLTIMIISSNDLFKFTSKDEFKQNSEILIQQYLKQTEKLIIIGPGRVFQTSGIPLILKSVYKIRSDFYGETLTQISNNYSNVFHVNPLEDLPVENYENIEARDNFHPNNLGHTYWFNLISYGYENLEQTNES